MWDCCQHSATGLHRQLHLRYQKGSTKHIYCTPFLSLLVILCLSVINISIAAPRAATLMGRCSLGVPLYVTMIVHHAPPGGYLNARFTRTLAGQTVTEPAKPPSTPCTYPNVGLCSMCARTLQFIRKSGSMSLPLYPPDPQSPTH